MLFVRQEERRASDMVLFSSENNDMANQSVDRSFFNSEKNGMTNQLASLARRNYFYLDAFWRVNLGMYIIINKYTLMAKPIKTLELHYQMIQFLITHNTSTHRCNQGARPPFRMGMAPRILHDKNQLLVRFKEIDTFPKR